MRTNIHNSPINIQPPQQSIQSRAHLTNKPNSLHQGLATNHVLLSIKPTRQDTHPRKRQYNAHLPHSPHSPNRHLRKWTQTHRNSQRLIDVRQSHNHPQSNRQQLPTKTLHLKLSLPNRRPLSHTHARHKLNAHTRLRKHQHETTQHTKPTTINHNHHTHNINSRQNPRLQLSLDHHHLNQRRQRRPKYNLHYIKTPARSSTTQHPPLSRSPIRDN